MIGVIHVVADRPPARHARSERALQHGLSELRFGDEAHALRHARIRAACGITGPGLGQVQHLVDQRMVMAATIGGDLYY